MKNIKVIIGMSAAIIFCAFIGSVYAQGGQSAEGEVKVVSGEVSAIDATGIAVVYDRNYDTGAEYEIFVPVDKNTPIKHKGSLKEIKAGDLVSVEYVKTKEGKTVAKSVSFIQAAVPDALVSNVVTPAPDAPQATTQNEGEAQ